VVRRHCSIAETPLQPHPVHDVDVEG
jgi:hypothetical protein